MNALLKNTILLALMIAASGMAVVMRPTHRIADNGPKVDLETMIPEQFGEWHREIDSSARIVDPQQQEKIDKIYTQTLTRTYVNTQGLRIMLSIAYGNDQRDSMQVHYPEVCYPAQGFTLLGSSTDVLKSEFGDIRVKRLRTQLGERFEPVTYWTTLGGQIVQGSTETKLAQLKFGFRRAIPDGLLFRVSSITPDSASAYVSQQDFVRSLISSLSETNRVKLTGLLGSHVDR